MNPLQFQLSLTRGHRWLALIESGEARNLAKLAEMDGMDRASVSRMAKCTTLAPDIVARSVDAEQAIPTTATGA